MLTLHEVIMFFVSMQISISSLHSLFFFNDTATTEIYTLSLHDALPISIESAGAIAEGERAYESFDVPKGTLKLSDRKSTRLNSSHQIISYAVFCLKKKKINISSLQTQNVNTVGNRRDAERKLSLRQKLN